MTFMFTVSTLKFFFLIREKEVGKIYKYEEGGLRLFMFYFRKVVLALTILIFCL